MRMFLTSTMIVAGCILGAGGRASAEIDVTYDLVNVTLDPQGNGGSITGYFTVNETTTGNYTLAQADLISTIHGDSNPSPFEFKFGIAGANTVNSSNLNTTYLQLTNTATNDVVRLDFPTYPTGINLQALSTSSYTIVAGHTKDVNAGGIEIGSNPNVGIVPEPSSLALAGSALVLGLSGAWMRRKFGVAARWRGPGPSSPHETKVGAALEAAPAFFVEVGSWKDSPSLPGLQEFSSTASSQCS